MKSFLRLHLITIVVFLAIDAVWLGILAKDFYRIHLGPILPLTLSIAPALSFYLLFTAGIVFFAVVPAIQKNSFKESLLRGAFFGLVTYGTYDLTNQATILHWPIIVTVADMIWGSFLTAAVSAATFWLDRRKKNPPQFFRLQRVGTKSLPAG